MGCSSKTLFLKVVFCQIPVFKIISLALTMSPVMLRDSTSKSISLEADGVMFGFSLTNSRLRCIPLSFSWKDNLVSSDTHNWSNFYWNFLWRNQIFYELNKGFVDPKASIVAPVTADESGLIKKVHNLAISTGSIILTSPSSCGPNAST